MGWLIALAVMIGLAVLPVGVRAVYRESQPGVWLLIGPVKVRVFPARPKQDKKEKKSTKPKPAKAKQPAAKEKKGGSYRDFIPVIKTVLAFLEHFRRKLRVNDLQLKVILAGGDPCDLAVNYGKAWTAVGNLMPQLERFLVIKKRNIEVECDFTADATLIYAKADVTITVARTLHLLGRYGIKVLKDLLELKKIRKGGAEL